MYCKCFNMSQNPLWNNGNAWDEIIIRIDNTTDNNTENK